MRKGAVITVVSCLSLAAAWACGPSPSKKSAPDAGARPDGGAACDPVAQSGCSGASSKCGFLGDGAFGCQAPGAGGDQQSCTVSAAGDDCQAGFACLALNGAAPRCFHFCDHAAGNAGCPGADSCSLSVTHSVSKVTADFCAPSCDPLAQDCPAASDACYPAGAGTACLPPKSPPVANGLACAYANDCAKGSACLTVAGTGSSCYQMCNSADGGAPTCTTGACTPTSSGFGVCQ